MLGLMIGVLIGYALCYFPLREKLCQLRDIHVISPKFLEEEYVDKWGDIYRVAAINREGVIVYNKNEAHAFYEDYSWAEFEGEFKRCQTS